MFIEKTNIQVDLDSLRKSIGTELNFLKDKNRICINSLYENAMYDNVKRDFIYKEFKYIAPNFKNTIWEDTLNLIPSKKTRARIMMMPNRTLLSMHRDIERRYHVALYTDPACIFYNFEEQRGYHIPSDGYVYLVDTKKLHTFINATKNCKRVHLVVGEYV